EPHPGGGDAVEVRRLIDFASVTTQRMRRVVVGKNEENVRPLGRGGCGKRTEDHQCESQDEPTGPANPEVGTLPLHGCDPRTIRLDNDQRKNVLPRNAEKPPGWSPSLMR